MADNASDLVETLRDSCQVGMRVQNEAADEIERLRAQLAAAEAEKLELANHVDGCVRVAAEALQGRQAAEAQLEAARKALERIEIRTCIEGKPTNVTEAMLQDFNSIAREALRTLTPVADK